MRQGSVAVKETRDWLYFYNSRTTKLAPPKSPFTYKLRINLSAADYQRLKLQINRYLTTHLGKGTLHSFKTPTTSCQRNTKADHRFNDNGQYTLYLCTPYHFRQIHDFIGDIQSFLSNQHAAPVQPMPGDFTVMESQNISMRVERMYNLYLPVVDLKSNPITNQAYEALVNDSAGYKYFALGQQTVLPDLTSNIINQLMWLSITSMMQDEEALSASYLNIGLKLRKLFRQSERISATAVNRLLHPEEWKLLRQAHIEKQVLSLLLNNMLPKDQQIFLLTKYTALRLSEGCLETGSTRDTFNYFASLFDSRTAQTKLTAARKILLTLTENQPLSLSSDERKACLRRSDRLWQQVIRPARLEKLVKKSNAEHKTTLTHTK